MKNLTRRTILLLIIVTAVLTVDFTIKVLVLYKTTQTEIKKSEAVTSDS